MTSPAENLWYQSKKLLHNLGRKNNDRGNIESLHISYGKGATYVTNYNAVILKHLI